jgi:hypothetical protein
MQDDGLMLFRPADEVQAAAVRMKQLGVDRVRITAYWSSLTRDPDSETKPDGFDAADPGAYEQALWAPLDTAVRAVRAAGMDVLIDIGFWAPHWATDDPPGPRARSNIDPQAYADFAKAVAMRYSGAFTPPPDPPQAAATPPQAPPEDAGLIGGLIQPLIPFPVPDPLTNPQPPSTVPPTNTGGEVAPAEPLPRVDEFALWNEPNHQGLLLPQWKPDGTTPASPDVYRAMVRAGYAAVKGARPSTTVLIGNTSSTGGKPGSGPVPPLEFLRDLACVDANMQPVTTGDCAGYTQLPGDGWAHHPYSQNERPSRVSDPVKEPGDVRMADLPALAATLNQLVKMGRISPADANIYITEFGYETKGIPGRPNVNETQQARWLTWAEYIADSIPTVHSFAQFLLRDQPPSPTRVSASNARPYGEYSTGLLHVDGSDKLAAKTFVAGLFAQLKPHRKVLIYGRLRLGPGPKLIVLQRSIKGGPWTRVEQIVLDGTAAFEATIPHVPGASYRITYPGPVGPRKSGLAIKPVPITG